MWLLCSRKELCAEKLSSEHAGAAGMQTHLYPCLHCNAVLGPAELNGKCLSIDEKIYILIVGHHFVAHDNKGS